MSSYFYKGKKYTKKTTASKAWSATKKLVNRVLEAADGGHLKGHREPEHYINQAMKEVESKLAEGKKDE